MQVQEQNASAAGRRTVRVAWVLILGVIALGCLDLATRQMVRSSLSGGARDEGMYGVLAAVLVAGGAGLVLARRRRATPDRIVALALAMAFAGGLTAQLALGARLQSDGFYYFAYVRSLWFDRDIDLANDYRMLGLGDKPQLFRPTQTGHAQSAWTIGPALAWSPFFGAAHVVARAFDPARQVTADGTSFPYRQAICIADLLYGLLGTWFCYRLASLYFPRGLSAAATGVTIGGSFMLWYLVKEPTMSHALSMCGVAAFMYAWAKTTDHRTLVGWAWLGLLAGFVATIRWQNALFALLPAAEAALLLLGALARHDRPQARRILLAGILFIGTAAAGFAPQMLAWKAIYGHYLAVSPLSPQIRLANPQLLDTLWSSRDGLLATSPILYLALLGLLPFVRSRPRVGVPMLLALAAMVYFNASIQDWWGGDAFGGRRFDGTLPLLAIGTAAFIRFARQTVERRPGLVVAAVLGALVLWNVTFMKAALSGIVQPGGPVEFGSLAAYQAQTVHAWFGHPFAYPVTLVYAARNGVSPAHAEVLRAKRFLADPLRPWATIHAGDSDRAFLGRGWYDAERDGDTTYRWAQPEADLVVPLDHAEMLDLQLRLRPFTDPLAPRQQLRVKINNVVHGPIAVADGWQIVQLRTERSEWRSGVNRVSLQFSRGTRPMAPGAGGDARTLSAAIDYLRIRTLER
jgi:hypothetical protein